MEALLSRVLSTKRDGSLSPKPIFEPYKPAADLEEVEARIGTSLPASLKAWLMAAGYGDLNDVLSFRSQWFNAIDTGELRGHVIFAQDDLGNFYSFSPVDGTIHFISRSAPEFVALATDFESFVSELEKRDFRLREWTDSLEVRRYSWRA
jgi:hypothetical protein